MINGIPLLAPLSSASISGIDMCHNLGPTGFAHKVYTHTETFIYILDKASPFIRCFWSCLINLISKATSMVSLFLAMVLPIWYIKFSPLQPCLVTFTMI